MFTFILGTERKFHKSHRCGTRIRIAKTWIWYISINPGHWPSVQRDTFVSGWGRRKRMGIWGKKWVEMSIAVRIFLLCLCMRLIWGDFHCNEPQLASNLGADGEDTTGTCDIYANSWKISHCELNGRGKRPRNGTVFAHKPPQEALLAAPCGPLHSWDRWGCAGR